MNPRPQIPTDSRPPRRQAPAPVRRTVPMSPAARRARERARARKRRQAQLRLGLMLTALVLALSLLAVGVAKCAGAGGGAGSDTGSSSQLSGLPAPESTGQASGESTADPQTAPVTTEPETEAVPTFAFTVPDGIESPYYLLLNRTTGEVLAEKNADEITYPASITKVMTVIAAMEELDDLEQSFTVTQDLMDRLVAAEASRAGFAVGETVKAKDLFYAAMLPSGADGSVGLADLVSGSEEAFAKLMTEKAKALGMENTNFTNATGLHDPTHYSTCRDLARLLDHALDNPDFREVFSTEYYQSSPTNVHESGIWMRSSMFRALELEMLRRDYFVGGKTGFTEEAGMCLASLAEYGGEEYLLITLGAGDGTNSQRWHVRDAAAIFDALFAQLG